MPIKSRNSEPKALRRALDWLTDHITAPVALVGPDAPPRCNGALERMLSHESDSGRRRVRDALKAVGEAMLAGKPADSLDERLFRVRTSTRHYLLEPLPAPENCAIAGLVHVHRARVELDTNALAARYGLSRREADVALLIARGASNKSIAAELELSPHTARRHTESVFRKVGVTSRAALAARLHDH